MTTRGPSSEDHGAALSDRLPWSAETGDEAGTQRFGERLGAVLPFGSVLALEGPLGAGKTAFVRGLAAGLGAVPGQRVTSPTYALVNVIALADGTSLVHADLYRLDDDPDALEGLGFRDWLAEARCVALEWADNVREAAESATLRVSIDDLGGSLRRITVAPGAAYRPASCDGGA